MTGVDEKLTQLERARADLERGKSRASDLPEPTEAPGADESMNGHREIWSARDLLSVEFPEPRWAVPGIVPEGLTLLAGPPKVGKSWGFLALGLSVASGGRAFGAVPVEEGECLYMALEDGPRRLQSRLGQLLGDEEAPEGLHLVTEWPRLDQGGDEALDDWLAGHPDCRLLLVDVFARIRPPVNEKSGGYQADYQAGVWLKGLADRHATAVTAAHHTRKAAADDFVDTVSGTNGLAAAADTICVLKRSRGSADAELLVTGRDVEEAGYALGFDLDAGGWAIQGDAALASMSETRRRILEHLESTGWNTPKQVAGALGMKDGTARQTLSRMATDGQVDTDGNGHYGPASRP